MNRGKKTSRRGFLKSCACWVRRSVIAWDGLSPRNKVILINSGTLSLIGALGVLKWDYIAGDRFHIKAEEWFGPDTDFGGADKTGHFFSTYAYSEILGRVYRKWGYDEAEAARLSCMSAWLVVAMMEAFDGTSPTQGFSYEDVAMNSLGAVASYILQTNSALDDIVDFRAEYTFEYRPVGVLDDYSNLNYLLVVKLSGFEEIENELLQHLEVQLGYHTEGYDISTGAKTRSVFLGISPSLPKILRDRGFEKTAAVLEYLQIPYVSLRVPVMR